jgi:hypothetical protein
LRNIEGHYHIDRIALIPIYNFLPRNDWKFEFSIALHATTGVIVTLSDREFRPKLELSISLV